MTKQRKILLLAVTTVVLAILVGCVVYVSDYYRADEAANAALLGDENIMVQVVDGVAVFTPKDPVAGFIFYPGGKVEYTAYAPLMRSLAEKGVLCVLVKMPCNLAVLDSNAAKGIPDQYPDITQWYIGGHSLGGSMAASYAAKNTEVFEGLVLLASYSTAQIEDLAVLSIYGDRDGVLDMEKYKSYRSNLPENAEEIIIQGGNHAFFGSYGAQAGDGEASISNTEQTQTTAQAILTMILGKELP